MAKGHKAQHWVPKSYLKEWCDPDAPPTHEPYVHVFAKDGGSHRVKPPAKIFTERDLYTISREDGQRDLRLEHGLSGLEASFAEIRRDFLARRRALPTARHAKLMAFVAAMHSRTPAMRDHHLDFWGEVLEMGERLERRMKTASEEERRAAAVFIPPADDRQSMTMDDVRRVVASPMEHILVPSIAGEIRYLPLMRAHVLCTDDDVGFITSDSSVCWFDPEWHKKPPLFRNPSLSTELLEITLPLSPHQMLLITHQQDFNHPQNGIQYIDVLPEHVSEINRRTRFGSNEEFVVKREFTDEYWFHRGTMPPDAWEAQNGKSAPTLQKQS
jgi:hypothetical protein